MNARERAILFGKDIKPATLDESAIAYAVAHGGGDEPSYEVHADATLGSVAQELGDYKMWEVEWSIYGDEPTGTLYLNSSDKPLTKLGEAAYGYNVASVGDQGIVKERENEYAYYVVLSLSEGAVISDEDLSNTTVRILKKVEQGGGDIPEGLKPTYEFDFSAEPEEGSFTATPASGVTYAAIASALAETPHVYAKITFPSAMGLVVTARFNENITGDGQTGYYASALVLIAGDPTAINLNIGDNAGQTVCAGTIKILAVSN